MTVQPPSTAVVGTDVTAGLTSAQVAVQVTAGRANAVDNRPSRRIWQLTISRTAAERHGESVAGQAI